MERLLAGAFTVSYELLLLLAVVVLLPLIQLLVRAARQRDERLSEDGGGRPLANQPPKRGRAIDAPPVVPLLPATAGDSAPHAVTAREKTAPRDAMGPRSVPTGREGVRHQMAAKANLSDSAGLRRAMVLAAILGPCRAHDPDARREIGPS